MSTRRIVTRSTLGQNAEVFIAKDLAYPNDTTYQEFVELGEVGETAIFIVPASGDETQATKATAALSATDRFFIAQIQSKKDSNLPRDRYAKKTSSFLLSELTKKTITDFVLPVQQVTHVGYNGISGDVDFGGGIVKNTEYEIAILETTEGFQPYPTWSYNYVAKSSDTEYSVLNSIVEKVNNTLDFENKENPSIVRAEVIGTGTATTIGTTLTVTQDENIVVSAAAPTLAIGDALRIGGASGGIYLVTDISGNNITLSTPYQGKDASEVAGDVITGFTALGIQITAKEESTVFRIAVRGELVDSSVSYTTPFVAGSGFRGHVETLEYTGNIYDGETTINAQFAERYGSLTTFRNTSLAYDVVHLGYRFSAASKGVYNSEDVNFGNIYIAAPKTSGVPADSDYSNASASPLATIKTVLGL